MAESEEWDIYAWIGLIILSPILVPLLIILSPLIIILVIIGMLMEDTEEDKKNLPKGYDSHNSFNLASKETERVFKQLRKDRADKKFLNEFRSRIDRKDLERNTEAGRKRLENLTKELTKAERDKLISGLETHLRKIKHNLIDWKNSAEEINLTTERRDAYWCNGCEHNWVSRNIAGKSHICPKCRGDDLENIDLKERKEKHQILIDNCKVCKTQINYISKELKIFDLDNKQSDKDLT